MLLETALFKLAFAIHLHSMVKWFLKISGNNSSIVFFCHRILPPRDRFTPIDAFYYLLGHPTLDEFELQLRYLTRHHTIIRLEEAVDAVIEGKQLPPHSVALTFDDGYHDNYSLAFPLLEKMRCHASFFLTTDFIETGNIPFHDRFIYGLCHTKENVLRLDGGNEKTVHCDLTSLTDKVNAFQEVLRRFKYLAYNKRAAFTDQLLNKLGVKIDRSFKNSLMLRWKEIETMALAGNSFYSHTRSHPLLTTLAPAEVMREIIDSNNLLKERLGTDGKIFCYPYGKKGEFDESTVNILRKNGFVAACSAVHGVNRQGGDPYRIRRTAMISEPIEKFSLRAAGLFELLKTFH